jgi:hypothetical protein
MKHPSNQEFFAYWDEKRASERAPDRSEIEPSAVRELLGDIFVLSYDSAAGYPFRVAGTRICALLGRDLKDRSFSGLFVPFSHRAHAPVSLTGLLAPFESGHSVLSDFKLTSWRYLHPPAQRLVPRAIRKLKLARGLMVYEGLR